MDVDRELWEVLDMADDEELEELHNILYGRSPLSPVIKSLVVDNEPPAVAVRGREATMRRIDARFRFLAADSAATLRGHRPSYREALLTVRDRLEIKCPGGLATADLESEIFLYMLQRQARELRGLSDGRPTAAASAFMASEGDGMASGFAQSQAAKNVEQLAAPLKLGGQELLPTLLKLGSALWVRSFSGVALRQLGANLLTQHARYEAALQLLCRSSAKGIAATVPRQLAVQTAQKGVTLAAVRYSTVRGALSMLGPIMWAWLGVDLALKAVGTDYGRIVRAVFALAQIRLLRTHGFTNPA
ncbi:hypothetical protein WJX72_007661 [[Myrmecia] bisecta]|uniref:Uncharacterized protein n=1 Tax=[Myrmecia] bisecta TaxID=41462 RepID=A0AAW1PNS8_9CHLO